MEKHSTFTKLTIKELLVFALPLLLVICGVLLWRFNKSNISPASLLWVVEGSVIPGSKGNVNGIKSVAFSSDNSLLVNGGGYWGKNTGEVIVWDMRLGQKRSVLKTGDVSAVAISNDNAIIAISEARWTQDGNVVASKITIWNLNTENLLHTWLIDGQRINFLSFDSSGVSLMAGGTRGNVKIFNLSSKKLIKTLSLDSHLTSPLVVSPKGDRLCGGSGSLLKIWSSRTGKLLRILSDHKEKITTVSFSTNNLLASGGLDDTLKIWDAITGKVVNTIDTSDFGVTTKVTFSHDGKQIASGHIGRSVVVWDVKSAKLKQIITKQRGGSIKDLIFSPDDKVLVSVDGNTAKAWDISGLN